MGVPNEPKRFGCHTAVDESRVVDFRIEGCVSLDVDECAYMCSCHSATVASQPTCTSISNVYLWFALSDPHLRSVRCMMNVLAFAANIRLVLESSHISGIYNFTVVISILAFYIWAFILQSAWDVAKQFGNYSGDHVHATPALCSWAFILQKEMGIVVCKCACPIIILVRHSVGHAPADSRDHAGIRHLYLATSPFPVH